MNYNLISDNFYRRIDKGLVEMYLKEGKRVQHYWDPPSRVFPACWRDISPDYFDGEGKDKIDAFLNGCGPFRVVEIRGAELIDDLENDDFNSSIYISMNDFGTINLSVYHDSSFDTSCYYIQPTRSGVDNAKRIAKVLTAWADNIEMCGLIEKEEV
jgi:hypothetical protein